jgi:hypothetical protein
MYISSFQGSTQFSAISANFLRKMGVFFKSSNFAKTSSILNKRRQFFGEYILKIITSVPLVFHSQISGLSSALNVWPEGRLA